ncbi:MAG: hypothetical protein II313_00200 [Anaerotignum sp.]|nr:hypothetical protein [Anaerotignum sp.]
MKKKILLFLTFILSAAPISAAAIDVNINNRKLALDVPASIINDRTMVPMRAIFENLGATVIWDEPTKGITAKKGSDIIRLTLNKKTAYINGSAKTLDAPPTARNGRTLVPARFVAEALGCGGCMQELRRVQAGEYTIAEAVPLKTLLETETPEAYLRGVDTMFRNFSEVKLTPNQEKRCRNGNAFSVNLPEGTYRAYSQTGEFLMLAKVEEGTMSTVKSFFDV